MDTVFAAVGYWCWFSKTLGYEPESLFALVALAMVFRHLLSNAAPYAAPVFMVWRISEYFVVDAPWSLLAATACALVSSNIWWYRLYNRTIADLSKPPPAPAAPKVVFMGEETLRRTIREAVAK